MASPCTQALFIVPNKVDGKRKKSLPSCFMPLVVLESHTDKKKKRNKAGKELLVGVEKNCNVKCSGQNDLDWEVICRK